MNNLAVKGLIALKTFSVSENFTVKIHTTFFIKCSDTVYQKKKLIHLSMTLANE